MDHGRCSCGFGRRLGVALWFGFRTGPGLLGLGARVTASLAGYLVVMLPWFARFTHDPAPVATVAPG